MKSEPNHNECARVRHASGEGSREFLLERDGSGSWRGRFAVAPGLYQFSAIVDARDFDWEKLYFPLDQYGNQGDQTGPWDFDLRNGNEPLVPAYWVERDGERLGLWFFQRISLEDLGARRFRGRFAFQATKRGPVELKLIPYRPLPLRWVSLNLEVDPQETLLPPEALPFLPGRQAPASAWGKEAYWKEVQARLQGNAWFYRPALQRSFEEAALRKRASPEDLVLWLAKARLENDAQALAKGLETLDTLVALPHWGNPRQEGYGHNGDLGAATALRAGAWAWHGYGEALGVERAEALREKLRLQGNRFLTQALLNRDYWGGSLLQDHGWRSFFSFGTAVFHLLGILPEAEQWAALALPRIRRAIQAMPRDGAIPPSSYGSLFLYLDELTYCRDALLAISGEDLFTEGPFLPILDYVGAVLHAEEGVMIGEGIESPRFIGGGAFFNRMASLYQEGRAAWFARKLLEQEAGGFFHSSQAVASRVGVLHSLLAYDAAVEPVAPSTPPLVWFEDSGLVQYREPASGITLSLRCGPINGYHAYRHATGPCDRISSAPGAGHFLLALGTTPLLVTPDGGYRLRSSQRSCLLVDAEGPSGDVGYPMSIPAWEHQGEHIERVCWDELTREGTIRLILHPAYPKAHGMISYIRTFALQPSGRLVCRDHVVLERPRKLSWLFQTEGDAEVVIGRDDLKAVIGPKPRFQLSPIAEGCALHASVLPTKVVWSYSSASGRKPFKHLRYDTAAPVAEVAIDFVFHFEPANSKYPTPFID